MAEIGQNENIPKLIYVTGIDGSGKSTVCEHLAERLQECGYSVNVEWLRYNHVFSKPLLGLCRVFGLTRYETHDGIRVGYHDFYKSRMISWVFVLLQYLDALRVKYTKILPGMKGDKTILILDRYVYDILIDLMVDTRLPRLDQTWIGKKFIGLLPPNICVVPIIRDTESILRVRPECMVDGNFENRIQLYEDMIERNSLRPVPNDSSLENLIHRTEKAVGLLE